MNYAVTLGLDTMPQDYKGELSIVREPILANKAWARTLWVEAHARSAAERGTLGYRLSNVDDIMRLVEHLGFNFFGLVILAKRRD